MLLSDVTVVTFMDTAGFTRRAAVEDILEDAGPKSCGGDWAADAAAVSTAEVRA